MPNIDIDDSHPDECSILDEEFIFETVILSDRGYFDDIFWATIFWFQMCTLPSSYIVKYR